MRFLKHELEQETARLPKLDRRDFLTLAIVGLTGLGAALVGVPVVTALFVPQLEEEPSVWRAVGKESKFVVGNTVLVTFDDPSNKPYAGETAHNAAWLRRDSQTTFTAFSIHCTHLGCPVRWLPSAELFMCPCHGGVFYSDGRVAAGPPPVPLYVHPTRIRNGQVELKTIATPIT